MALLCLNFKTMAQNQKDNIKQLNIGDIIPESVWNMPLQVVNHPQGKKTITLNDYRGKLIILDFWATWCGSCIAAMPKMQIHLKPLKEDAIALPVTYEPSSRIVSFMSSNQTMKQLNSVSIVEDTILKKLFPHYGIPHLVWIGKNGKILGTTSQVQVNERNLKKAISGLAVNMPTKIDKDMKQPLFWSDLPYANLKNSSLFLKGFIEGIGSGVTNLEIDDLSWRIYKNRPLLSLYQISASNLVASFVFKNVRLDVERPELLVRPNTMDRDVWEEVNSYTYQIAIPKKEKDSLYAYLFKDLNRYSPYTASISYEMVPIWEIKNGENATALLAPKGSKSSEIINSNGLTVLNGTMATFIVKLNNSFSSIIFKNSTDIRHKIDLVISQDSISDLAILEKKLEKYNLFITKRVEKMPILIIKDKAINKNLE